DEDTAALEPDDQARLAAAAIDASPFPAYGYLTSGVTRVAVASSRGVHAEQMLTDTTAVVLAAGEAVSGYAERASWRARELDPAGLPKAFDFEGVPKRRVELVEAGVARGVVWDRETAVRAGNGHVSTGHAPAPLEREWGPQPLALALAGGEAASTEDLA